MGSYWLQLPIFTVAVSCTLHCKCASALGVLIPPSWTWLMCSVRSAMESGVRQISMLRCLGLQWGKRGGDQKLYRNALWQSINSNSLQMGFKSDVDLKHCTVYGLQWFCVWNSAFAAAGSKFLLIWSSKQWHEDPCQRPQRASYFRIRYSSEKMFVYGKYRDICKKLTGGKKMKY